MQPLPGEVLDQRGSLGVGEHPLYLLGERRPQLVLLSQAKQFLVGDAAPEEERQPGREFKIADGMHGSGCAALRVALDAEQEIGRDQDRSQGHFDPGFKTAAVFPADGEQLHQRCDVGGLNGPSIGAVCQWREDLPGTEFFWLSGTWAADEYPPPALGVAGAGGIEGAANQHVLKR